MSPPRVILIGVGNPYRRDDGIGPALVAEIDKVHPTGVTRAVADGEPTGLIDLWSGAELAVVVDALRCDPSTPGRIHRSTPDGPWHGSAAASTHGLGIPEAFRLAQALDRAPRRLVIYGIEAADLGIGLGLSPAVAAALPRLTKAVLAEFD